MSATLRIALSTFSIVPLQRALNYIGAAIITPALLWELFRPATAPIATFFVAIGILLIVLTPFFGGGPALRFASTPTVMHLRPRGRSRMLLGAALGITMIAALVAFPFLVQQLLAFPGGPTPPDVPVAALFTVMWICTALAWVVLFAFAGAPRALFPFVFILSVMVGPIIRYVGSSSAALTSFVIGTLAALIASVVWYARTDGVRRPVAFANTNSWYFGGNATGDEGQPAPSHARVLRQYLVGSSLGSQALSGLFVIGMLVLVTVLPRLTQAQASGPNPFIVMALAPLGIMVGTLGHVNARRARLLWLRAGLDRAALFALAEREGLICSAMSYGIPVVALVGAGIFIQPGAAAEYLAYGLVSLASALCIFLAGLSTTRNWDAADISLMAGMVVLQIVITVLARPGTDDCVPWALGFTAALPVLALILRAYAKRRWLVLDWRVMRMLQTRR